MEIPSKGDADVERSLNSREKDAHHVYPFVKVCPSAEGERRKPTYNLTGRREAKSGGSHLLILYRKKPSSARLARERTNSSVLVSGKGRIAKKNRRNRARPKRRGRGRS